MYHLLAVLLLCTTVANDPVKNCVTKFAAAIAQRDTDALDTLLHPEFRVIANRFPTADKTTLLDKRTYLQLLTSGKIGGETYEVEFGTIDFQEHVATVITIFRGPKTTMQTTLLLVLDTNGDWRIISDLALIQPNQ